MNESIEEVNGQMHSLPNPAVYAVQLSKTHLDPDALFAIQHLERNGFTAYLVGGGVRDLLLGYKPKDFDIATNARPQEVKRVFRNCRIIGRRFQLCHLWFKGQKIIECATFRRDPEQSCEILPPDLATRVPCISESPVRLVPNARIISENDDLLIRHDNHFGVPHEDTVRRDFTVNGLFYDVRRKAVIDYVGGMADLERRLIRTVGDPHVRFREDPIRMLRAVKFGARLDMGIAPEVYDAIVEQREDLKRASKPRVLEEILRLLRGGAAHRSIYLAWDMGLLAEVLPELSTYLDDVPTQSELTWRRLMAVDHLVKQGTLPSDAVLWTVLLMAPLEEAISDRQNQVKAYQEFMYGLTQRLTLPKRTRERLWQLFLLKKYRTRPKNMRMKEDLMFDVKVFSFIENMISKS